MSEGTPKECKIAYFLVYFELELQRFYCPNVKIITRFLKAKIFIVRVLRCLDAAFSHHKFSGHLFRVAIFASLRSFHESWKIHMNSDRLNISR